ncbi:hypothetical protein [Afipia sp. GAS231]|uniref:hypothetical protein n=1 Tax=Afipia sp. GAS231 TaxID=1882747 RepID=UPI0012F9144B|nr:hypothetical protein [Afipia sp. GAS231]
MQRENAFLRLVWRFNALAIAVAATVVVAADADERSEGQLELAQICDGYTQHRDGGIGARRQRLPAARIMVSKRLRLPPILCKAPAAAIAALNLYASLMAGP